MAVWQEHFASLNLGGTDAAGFVTLTESLPGLAQERNNAVQVLDEARQTRDNTAQTLKTVALRVPKIIEGRLNPDSGVIDDLDKVYAIRPFSFARIEARARKLLPVWTAADAWLAAQVPAQPAILVGAVDALACESLLVIFGPHKQQVANAEQGEDSAADALQARARMVEKLCIRFPKAAKGTADAGSPAAASLATVPTTTPSNLPAALRIVTFSQGGVDGLQLVALYAPYGLEPDETAELQYKRLDIDADWQSVPYDASGNAIGPFAIGQTVKARTRVTHPSGSREGGVRQLTLIAP